MDVTFELVWKFGSNWWQLNKAVITLEAFVLFITRNTNFYILWLTIVFNYYAKSSRSRKTSYLIQHYNDEKYLNKILTQYRLQLIFLLGKFYELS